jgi:transcription initiation factor TFIIF subunit beta
MIRNGDKTEIIFDVADSIVKDAAKDSKIPKLHKFAINDIPDQHLAVFSHTKDDKGLNKTVLEGTVLQKGECRPIGGELYMGLKRQAFEKAQEPKRQVIALDRAVNSFKPVSVHIADLENEKKKKAEGKKSREDKDKVVDMIMTAFQKHQYYGLKDLVRITNQPVVSHP